MIVMDQPNQQAARIALGFDWQFLAVACGWFGDVASSIPGQRTYVIIGSTVH